jgi:hypothetical protein
MRVRAAGRAHVMPDRVRGWEGHDSNRSLTNGTDTIDPHRYGASRIFNAAVSHGPPEVEPSVYRIEYGPAVS